MAEMSRIPARTNTQPAARLFLRDRDGVAMVEFALVAPLFFGLLFAIMELAIIYLRSTAIDAGVAEAQRLTMTGQIAGISTPAAQQQAFRAAFCRQTDWIINCNDAKFDVRAFNTFGVAALPSPIVNGRFDPANLQFNPGRPCQIVLIRAYYESLSLTGFIRNDVANLGNGNVLIGGSAAFRNEPFGAC